MLMMEIFIYRLSSIFFVGENVANFGRPLNNKYVDSHPMSLY